VLKRALPETGWPADALYEAARFLGIDAVRAEIRRSVTRTIGVPGTGIFYMSRTGTQTGMHSATPPADPARDPAVDARGAVEECPFGQFAREGQPAAVPAEPVLGDAEAGGPHP